MLKIWLNPEFIRWPSYDGGDAYLDGSYVRSYELLERANSFINSENNSEFDRADCVTWLKRSLNTRLQLIEKIYSLRSIPTKKIKGTIQLLEYFGLVKPLMLHELLNIRNDIEHNDAPPPSEEKCHEWSEIIWYFLRSTDEIVKNLKNNISFVSYNEAYPDDTIDITINFNSSPSFMVCGLLNHIHFSTDEVLEWPKVQSSKQLTPGDPQLKFSGELFMSEKNRIDLVKAALVGIHV